MSRVTTNPLQPLTAGQWPQDSLAAPMLSGMPAIAVSNLRVKRESFTVVGKLLQISYGIFDLALMIPAYGDFWCRGFGVWSPTFVAASGDALLSQPFAHVQIMDGRTGYKFFSPYAWLSNLTGFAPSFTIGGLNLAPDPTKHAFAPQSSSDLPQPHCFTRNSTIQISVNRQFFAGLASPANIDVYFRFDGWLEYANASG